MITMVFGLFILFFSVVVHEYAHGYAAYRQGDDTAKVLGRLTLNPIPHIDPIGTLLLPILLILSHSPVFFAWAKPVPINPLRFKDYDQGMIRVGLAGPLTNILLGTILAGLARLIGPASEVTQFFLYGAIINYVLAFFNLIPVPPLDGSRIVSVFLPFHARMQYERLDRYGVFIVVGLLWIGIFNWLGPLAHKLTYLIAGISSGPLM